LRILFLAIFEPDITDLKLPNH